MSKTDVRAEPVLSQKIPPGGVGCSGCILVLLVLLVGALASIGFAQQHRLLSSVGAAERTQILRENEGIKKLAHQEARRTYPKRKTGAAVSQAGLLEGDLRRKFELGICRRHHIDVTQLHVILGYMGSKKRRDHKGM